MPIMLQLFLFIENFHEMQCRTSGVGASLAMSRLAF